MFDTQPETLIDDERTLGSYLSPRSTFENFAETIRDTPWPTIKIVPSSLGLQDAEWDLTATLTEGGQAVRESLQALRIGISSVSKDFRSEERRVGKECVSTCRSRWSPYN